MATKTAAPMQQQMARAVLSIDGEEFKVIELEDLGMELIVDKDDHTGKVNGFVSWLPTPFTATVPLTTKNKLREMANSMETMTAGRDAVLRWYGLNDQVISSAVMTDVVLLRLVQAKTPDGAPAEKATFAAGTLRFDEEE